MKRDGIRYVAYDEMQRWNDDTSKLPEKMMSSEQICNSSKKNQEDITIHDGWQKFKKRQPRMRWARRDYSWLLHWWQQLWLWTNGRAANCGRSSYTTGWIKNPNDNSKWANVHYRFSIYWSSLSTINISSYKNHWCTKVVTIVVPLRLRPCRQSCARKSLNSPKLS